MAPHSIWRHMKKTVILELDRLRMPSWNVVHTPIEYGRVVYITVPFLLIVIMDSKNFMDGVRTLVKVALAPSPPKNDNCYLNMNLYHEEGTVRHEFIVQSKKTGKVWIYTVDSAPASPLETENIMRAGDLPNLTDDMVVIGMKT